MNWKNQIKSLLDPWIRSRKKLPKTLPTRRHGYWNYLFDSDIGATERILYIGGDSWLTEFYIKTYLQNSRPNSLIINRALGGAGNHEIISFLEQDLKVLTCCPVPIDILIVFSEVGRNQSEMNSNEMKKYRTITEYLATVQQNQYQKVLDLCGNLKPIVTTAFVPNTFNSVPSIIDHVPDLVDRPCDCFNLSSRVYSWCMEQGFDMDAIMSDLDRVDQYVEWLTASAYIDETAHIKVGKEQENQIYKAFFESIQLT